MDGNDFESEKTMDGNDFESEEAADGNDFKPEKTTDGRDFELEKPTHGNNVEQEVTPDGKNGIIEERPIKSPRKKRGMRKRHTAKNGVKYGRCGFPSISANGKIEGR